VNAVMNLQVTCNYWPAEEPSGCHITATYKPCSRQASGATCSNPLFELSQHAAVSDVPTKHCRCDTVCDGQLSAVSAVQCVC